MEKQGNAWAIDKKYTRWFKYYRDYLCINKPHMPRSYLNHLVDRQLISEEDTFLWLSKGDLKAEIQSEIVAAQDQALQMKYYATKILSTKTDSKCSFANNLMRK